MKIWNPLVGLIVGVASSASILTYQEKTEQGFDQEGADRFVKAIEYDLRLRSITLSDEEKDALATIYPFLWKVMEHPVLLHTFWETLRDAPHEKLEWEDAKALIRSGKIRIYEVPHEGDISLVTWDGRRYFTRDKEKDSITDAIREVDPKCVFTIGAIE